MRPPNSFRVGGRMQYIELTLSNKKDTEVFLFKPNLFFLVLRMCIPYPSILKVYKSWRNGHLVG